MPKRIVLCSDGTGNSDIKNRGTNVFKIFEAVDKHWYPGTSTAPRQIAFYDDGVGTGGLKYLRLFGAAFGWGLSRNVKDLYTELARVYSHQDEIYLFGFSRGAFTVRTLAGFIGHCGILNASIAPHDKLEEYVDALYKKYRERYWHRSKEPWFWRLWKGIVFAWFNLFSGKDPKEIRIHPVVAGGEKAHIAFMGVWDTVDAVGLPIDWLAEKLNNWIYPFKFPSKTLNPCVAKACHAISIDDERHTFHPVLWEGTDKRIEQVWFSGVHANVGGGYPKQGLSLVALDWIAGHAEKAGLRFVRSERDYFRQGRNARCKLYDSRAGIGVYYRYLPRDVDEMCKRHGIRPMVHLSVLERISSGTAGYAPGNICGPVDFVDWDPATMDIITVPDPRPALPGTPGANSSLLHKVRFYLKIRRYAHYATLAATLILGVLTLFLVSMDATGISQTSHGTLFWIILVVVHIALYIWPMLLLAAAYLVGRWARRKMHREFCEYWFAYQPQLSKFTN
jgi:uncharacterized protein (DUF2235 family)